MDKTYEGTKTVIAEHRGRKLMVERSGAGPMVDIVEMALRGERTTTMSVSLVDDEILAVARKLLHGVPGQDMTALERCARQAADAAVKALQAAVSVEYADMGNLVMLLTHNVDALRTEALRLARVKADIDQAVGLGAATELPRAAQATWNDGPKVSVATAEKRAALAKRISAAQVAGFNWLEHDPEAVALAKELGVWEEAVQAADRLAG